ncbi:unnamed protein product [Arctia plantaginis]|uniref:Secreted protein n=1 Tax=Arctia plantaginis TaxID=874455 RepID=A0A8S0ZGU5_ARCPL|nr:unnamed protein product [Arctia plantaginis]CAB3231995.1 unnamed protein product [Arctia plantaginis]
MLIAAFLLAMSAPAACRALPMQYRHPAPLARDSLAHGSRSDRAFCATTAASRSVASNPQSNLTAPEYLKLSSANSLCLMTSLFSTHTNCSRRFSSEFPPNSHGFESFFISV